MPIVIDPEAGAPGDAAPSAKMHIFSGEIDEDLALETVTALEEWSGENPGQALHFVINSHGGDVGEGLFIFETLRSLSRRGHHVTTLIRGEAMSMAAYLVQAGDLRVMGSHSRMMLHELSKETSGSLTELRSSVDEADDLSDLLYDIVCSRSKLVLDMLAEVLASGPWYMTPAEALDLGLVDEVLA